MRPLELGAFLALGTIWGASFLFIKWASSPSEGFPPMTLVAMRLLLGSVVMFLYNIFLVCLDARHWHYGKYLVRERRDFFWKALVMGILNNSIPFTLVAWAESNYYVNVGVASVIDSAIPIFTQLIGHYVLHEEQLTRQRLLGILLGFGGVIVVCLEKIVKVGPSGDDTENRLRTLGYYMLIIIATMSYGSASVFGRRCLVGFPCVWAISGQIMGGALVNTILALSVDFYWPFDAFAGQTHFSFFANASQRAYLSIVYLGVVATCGAYVFYFYLLRTVGSVKQSMVGFLLPVVGLALGVGVQHEWRDIQPVYKLTQVLGAAMVGVSIFLVNFQRPPSQYQPIKTRDSESALISTENGSGATYGALTAAPPTVVADGVTAPPPHMPMPHER